MRRTSGDKPLFFIARKTKPQPVGTTFKGERKPLWGRIGGRYGGETKANAQARAVGVEGEERKRSGEVFRKSKK